VAVEFIPAADKEYFMTFDFNMMNILLLALFLAAGVWTVLTSHLLRSAIGLAVTSIILTLLLFLMKAPIAGVFELSVCAGLITVVFISAISLVKPVAEAEARELKMKRLKRFIFLPLILVLAAWVLFAKTLHLTNPAQLPVEQTTLQHVLWFTRRFDLIGQILIILAGVFGVIVLFKTKAGQTEKQDNER
jgi:NADH-quinone oxidoreductase subunit J